jgi:hypothetical protein
LWDWFFPVILCSLLEIASEGVGRNIVAQVTVQFETGSVSSIDRESDLDSTPHPAFVLALSDHGRSNALAAGVRLNPDIGDLPDRDL